MQDNSDVVIIFLVPLLGELAQLGERNAGSVEVRGSSPLFSIEKSLVYQGFFYFRFRMFVIVAVLSRNLLLESLYILRYLLILTHPFLYVTFVTIFVYKKKCIIAPTQLKSTNYSTSLPTVVLAPFIYSRFSKACPRETPPLILLSCEFIAHSKSDIVSYQPTGHSHNRLKNLQI